MTRLLGISDRSTRTYPCSASPGLRPNAWLRGCRGIALLMVFCLITSEITLADAPSKRGYTRRSFLLLWPGQTEDKARLDLDAPLVTDRPNFTDAASTVGRGVSQIEFGYTYSHGKTNSSKGDVHTYPEAAIRYGVLRDWIELRIRQSLLSQDLSDESATGFGDTYLGTKLGLLPQHGALPQIAVQPQMTLPTGSGSSGTKHILPGLNVLLFWSLTDRSFLTGSSQVNRLESANSSDINSTWAQSAAVGTQIHKRLSCFVEWFGIFQDSVQEASDSHSSDAGLIWLYDRDTQLDIRFGTGLQDRFGKEFFAGIGMSVRFGRPF